MKNTTTRLAASSLCLAAAVILASAQEATAAKAQDISSSSFATAWNVPVSGIWVVAEVDAFHSSDNWSDVKDYGYDMRVQLFAGLRRVEAKVDRQMAELRTKRARLRQTTTDTQGWDAAMREMVNARDELRKSVEDLGNATFETWNFQRDRVGKAFKSTQDYYAKVKDSTTSE